MNDFIRIFEKSGNGVEMAFVSEIKSLNSLDVIDAHTIIEMLHEYTDAKGTYYIVYNSQSQSLYVEDTAIVLNPFPWPSREIAQELITNFGEIFRLWFTGVYVAIEENK